MKRKKRICIDCGKVDINKGKPFTSLRCDECNRKHFLRERYKKKNEKNN